MMRPDDVTADGAANAAGWEAAGRRIAPMLGSFSAAVVTSADELAAAHVALGIGLAEAEHRRVAVGDLVGEVDPLQSLVSGDDPHGISDSFTYGVSLNRIARAVDTTGNLFVMPSGTGSVADPAIFRNSRWQRLANGFREVGALLLLVAPADAPGLKELIDQTDGVVLVGATPLDLAPYLNVLARVPAPLEGGGRAAARRPAPVWRIAAYLIALVAVIGAALYFRLGRGTPPRSAASRFRRGAGAAVAPPVRPAPAAAETIAVAPPANPADSGMAAAYAVELAAWNAPDDARQALDLNRARLPAATISPVPIGPSRETYYKVIAGAYADRLHAEALLDQLRRARVVQDALGTVVRTPYALVIDSGPASAAAALLAKYASLRQPLYELTQPDGRVKLYGGAFERPEDSATLMATLRGARLAPTLVYRTGSPR